MSLIPKSTQFKAMQLETLPPTYYVKLIAELVLQLGERWIRCAVSSLNNRYNIFLQCHKNKDGSLSIWHNPEKPNKQRSAAFDKLVALRRLLDDYKKQKALNPNPNAFLQEMFEVQDQIDALLNELKYAPNEPRKRRGNAIHQPLNVVLEFYSITQDIWDLLPPRVQARKKIQAEVAIKNRRRALEQTQ